MTWLLFLPFIIQGIAIAFDEAYFHMRRGLPKWERIGHPVDTATVLICMLFVLFVPYSATSLKWYIGLGILSCVMVTKDEWVHKHHCPATENWLHALLFINHPLVLSLVGVFWWALALPVLPTWLPQSDTMLLFLPMQTIGVACFMFYQIIYWNFLCKKSALQ